MAKRPILKKEPAIVRIVPTELFIKDNKLIWAWDEGSIGVGGHGTGKAQERSLSRALNEFVQVFEKQERVLEFARTYGPVGFCDHGFPLNHGGFPQAGAMGRRAGDKQGKEFVGTPFSSVPIASRYYCAPHELQPTEKRAYSIAGERTYFAESLASWSFYSEQAGALMRLVGRLKMGSRARNVEILALSASLRDESPELFSNPRLRSYLCNLKPGSELALRSLARDGPTTTRSDHARVQRLISGPESENRMLEALSTLAQNRDFLWNLISGTLNSWLAHAPVRFYCDAQNVGQKFKLRPYAGDERGIFPELALQLTTAVTGLQSPLICSGCGFPFMPVREPTRGDRTYCQTCRDNRVPQRDAERAYRQKNSPKTKKRGEP